MMIILSLPVRECGLKPTKNYRLYDKRTSLPVRECGLKLTDDDLLAGKV